MRTLELEKFEITELSFEERNDVNGGVIPWAAFWLGVGIGVGSIAIYDFANGVYAGVKQELAEK